MCAWSPHQLGYSVEGFCLELDCFGWDCFVVRGCMCKRGCEKACGWKGVPEVEPVHQRVARC